MTFGTPTMTAEEEAAWMAAMRSGVKVTDYGPAPAGGRYAPVSSPPRVARGAPAEPCVHRWVIETPNGPTCTGVCRACGATRAFNTTCEMMSAADLLSYQASQKRGGPRKKAVTEPR